MLNVLSFALYGPHLGQSWDITDNAICTYVLRTHQRKLWALLYIGLTL